MEIIYGVEKYEQGSYYTLKKTYRDKEELIKYLEEELDLVESSKPNEYINMVQNPYYMDEEPIYTIVEIELY